MGYISFDKLFSLLNRKNVKQQYLIDHGLNRRTLYKIKRGETITTETIALLCGLLNCQPRDIMDYISVDAPTDETRPETKTETETGAVDLDDPANIFMNYKE